MLNQVSMVGYLDSEPIIRYTDKGTLVCTFKIGCDRDTLSSDGDIITDYYDCVAFRYIGEYVSKYLSKGKAALITGSLRMREGVDRNGIEHVTPEIIVEQVYPVGWKKQQSISNQAWDPENAKDDSLDEDWDDEKDLPF